MLKRITPLLIAVTIATVGCSSMKVNNDYAHEADFSKYKTYAWHEDATSLKDENMLGHERIVRAVDGQMAAKGFSQVASNPDVYVTYHGSAQENQTLDTTSMGYGYGPGWGWGGFYGGMGMGSTTTQVRTYTTGTLVVDIWDAKEKALVWRGIASDTVSDNPQENAKKIQKAADLMFKDYPPK